MAVQAILRRHFPMANLQGKFKGQYASGMIDGEKIHLLMPHTYMNLSGESVRAALDFFKLDVDDVVIIHDELDLKLGDIRIKVGGGPAGHKGLKSIIGHLGTRDFRRVRFGIDHPGNKDMVSPYVLANFAQKKHHMLNKAVKKL